MRKVDNLHDIGMLKHGGSVRLAQDIHDVAGGHAGTVDKGDALDGDATAQVRVAADLDGAKTAGRERLERLEPLEQLARAGALKGTSGENRAVCCEKSGMANPRAFKVRLRAAGAGRAVRGGIDAASVARSGAWGG